VDGKRVEGSSEILAKEEANLVKCICNNEVMSFNWFIKETNRNWKHF
jgi:hypothetical protein